MSVFIQLMAYNQILEKWKLDPTQTKHQIGGWSHWISGGEGTDVPLSEAEVDNMKSFMRRHGPTAFYRLFPEDQ